MPIQAPRGVTQNSLGNLLPVPAGMAEGDLWDAIQGLSEVLGKVFKASPETANIATDQGSLLESAKTDSALLKKLAKLFEGTKPENIAKPEFSISREAIRGTDPNLSRVQSASWMARLLREMAGDYNRLLGKQ